MRLERCFVTLPCLLFRLFQFHKGAIRTTGLQSTEKFDGNFNSIKVRLERAVQPRTLVGDGDFNSIKVRLERSQPITDCPDIIFQFHKGAIRTGVPVPRRADFNDFNSIKVRLELL